jgi:hypothetical protein
VHRSLLRTRTESLPSRTEGSYASTEVRVVRSSFVSIPNGFQYASVCASVIRGKANPAERTSKGLWNPPGKDGLT